MKDYSTKPFTFKKKPVAIEAIKWTGTNFDTIKMFDPDVMLSGEGELIIPTLEDGKFITAKHVATVGDFVIKVSTANSIFVSQTFLWKLTKKLQGKTK